MWCPGVKGGTLTWRSIHIRWWQGRFGCFVMYRWALLSEHAPSLSPFVISVVSLCLSPGPAADTVAVSIKQSLAFPYTWKCYCAPCCLGAQTSSLCPNIHSCMRTHPQTEAALVRKFESVGKRTSWTISSSPEPSLPEEKTHTSALTSYEQAC